MNNLWDIIFLGPEFLLVFFLPGFFMAKIFIGKAELPVRIVVSVVLSILIIPSICFLTAICFKNHISKKLVILMSVIVIAFSAALGKLFKK